MSQNATHDKDSAHIISEAEVANKKTKLISELVNKQKKIEMLHKDILKRIKEHMTSITKYVGYRLT
jgi:hypothetical protein